MLIRIKGYHGGIKRYLEEGKKKDCPYVRDELDDRVILDGDLDLTNSIIESIDREKEERYLTVTLSFAEDHVDRETMESIVQEFKEFALHAYDQGEYTCYAEAHLPKIKSYTDQKTGEVVERKPHIHLVIPKVNLETGRELQPFGLIKQNIEFIDAFQEHINNEYGLASPKDNVRAKPVGTSDVISRYKGDCFDGASKEFKERILEKVMESKISNYDEFKKMLSDFGVVRVRNEGKLTEYLNVKPAEVGKGINLKESVFSRRFIELSDGDKCLVVARSKEVKYQEQMQSKKTPKRIQRVLDEWYSIKAKELRYINSGNRKLWQRYIKADVEEKKAIIEEVRNKRCQIKSSKLKFKKKFRTVGEVKNSPRKPGQIKKLSELRNKEAINEKRRNFRPPGNNGAARFNRIEPDVGGDRRIATTKPPNRVRVLPRSNLVGHKQQGSPVLLPEDKPDYMVRRQKRAVRNYTLRHSLQALQGGGGRRSNVVQQYQIDFNQKRAGEFNKFKQIDASLLLDAVSQSHGVLTEKYEITKAHDGSDRIKCGNRNLTPSDFLTKELHFTWPEAANVLRAVYADQPKLTPKRELWQAYLREWVPDRKKCREQEWQEQLNGEKQRKNALLEEFKATRQSINGDSSLARADRKAAISIARMRRVASEKELKAIIKEERRSLKDKYNPGMMYREYLKFKADEGNTTALDELIRQRDITPTIDGNQQIESVIGRATSLFLENIRYKVDIRGNVTYYDRNLEMFRDEGKIITFSTDEYLEDGLRLSLAKFGSKLRLSGTEEFKENVVRVAAKAELRVDFSDDRLNTLLKKYSDAEREKQTQGLMAMDTRKPQEQFAQVLRAAGLMIENEPIMDGALHRVPVEGDKGMNTSGAYIGHLDGHPAGFYENFRTGLRGKWKAENGEDRPFDWTPREIEGRPGKEEERLKQSDLAAQKARLIWNEAKESTEHPYLVAKDVRSHGLKTIKMPYIQNAEEIEGARWDSKNKKWYAGIGTDLSAVKINDGGVSGLLIPAVDIRGKIRTLQVITPDGTKSFLEKGSLKGCFYPILPDQKPISESKPILIAEGYATAATVAEATGLPTVVAFNAGNLKHVGVMLRQKFPDSQIIYAADNDYNLSNGKEVNVGKTKAEEAAAAVGGHVLLPPRVGDWNDLTRESHNMAKQQLLDGLKQIQMQERKEGISQQFPKYHLGIQASLYKIRSGGKEVVLQPGELNKISNILENGSECIPVSETKHHIVVGRMTREKLDKFLADGYKPAVILKTGPEYQAIVNIPKTGIEADCQIGSLVAWRLNREFGDPRIESVASSQIPGKKNGDAEVKLILAENRDCQKSKTIEQTIVTEIQQDTKVLKVYSLHYADLMKRQPWGGPTDPERLDAMIAVRMRVTGHSKSEIKEAILASSANKQIQDRNRHAERTATFAFSAKGDQDAADLEKYRRQWQKLEKDGNDEKPKVRI